MLICHPPKAQSVAINEGGANSPKKRIEEPPMGIHRKDNKPTTKRVVLIHNILYLRLWTISPNGPRRLRFALHRVPPVTTIADSMPALTPHLDLLPPIVLLQKLSIC